MSRADRVLEGVWRLGPRLVLLDVGTREAGADRVLARSAFVRNFAALLAP